MSSSLHKFGESIFGTGWVIFRQREDLAEHIAVSGTLELRGDKPLRSSYIGLLVLIWTCPCPSYIPVR
jgi:hypothetical protein